ncbi:MAG: D-alanine--D-alanine ligase A [Deltaproteobacteria bacterium RBG_13_43_22]|nr:MAG: D-alanine--D-alanine ligase A [Deltaproteobacteria bacterium RBG_13_43_22]
MKKKEKLRVAVLFGGKSAEHEVSIQSAKNVIDALDKERFEPVLIGIDKEGLWHLNDGGHLLINNGSPKLIALNRTSKDISLIPGAQKNQILSADTQKNIGRIDVIFPVLHGPFGEDGSIQGLLKLANLPFVGSGVLGSAVGMDKDVSKRLLRDSNIPIANFLSYKHSQKKAISFEPIVSALGLPFFVKPANLGSSVGISKVKKKGEFEKAVKEAFQYDRKIIFEENIAGREIECSVLGNENPVASIPGEVISNTANHDFYSYEAKYIDENGAVLEIPAKLSKEIVALVQDMAVRAYQVLCCEGMARVDFFLKPDGTLLVNELNTIPGFTAISMYTKLWEASGKSFSQLTSELIDLAIKRFKEENKLKTSID